MQDTGGFFVAVLQRKEKRTPSQPSAGREAESKRPAGNVFAPDDDVEDIPTAKRAKLGGAIDGELSHSESALIGSSSSGQSTGARSHALHRKERGVQDGDLPAETGGTFKENPFTFISAEEPSLVACM